MPGNVPKAISSYVLWQVGLPAGRTRRDGGVRSLTPCAFQNNIFFYFFQMSFSKNIHALMLARNVILVGEGDERGKISESSSIIVNHASN